MENQEQNVPVKNQGLRRRTGITLAAAGILAGAFTGSYLVANAATSATATATPAASSSTSASSAAGANAKTTTPPANNGVFVSNENATHESTESAAREAQENAGQRPSVP